MATNIKPPKRNNKKKAAAPVPTIEEAPDNLTRSPSGETVNLNFTVPKEFRIEFKSYAAAQDKSMIEILQEAFQLHKQAYAR